jgi:hypothetical protein
LACNKFNLACNSSELSASLKSNVDSIDVLIEPEVVPSNVEIDDSVSIVVSFSSLK